MNNTNRSNNFRKPKDSSGRRRSNSSNRSRSVGSSGSTNSSKQGLSRREVLCDIDDDLEEFEVSPSDDTELRGSDLVDRVTVWMNSWMDDDDGDFETDFKANRI